MAHSAAAMRLVWALAAALRAERLEWTTTVCLEIVQYQYQYWYWYQYQYQYVIFSNISANFEAYRSARQ